MLKRSEKVNINRGLWCGVAGRIEKGMTPEETAFKEIMEEIDLQKNQIELIGSVPPILIDIDTHNEALIYPFLFRTDNPIIKLDWEHTEYKWVNLNMINNLETVPRFNDILKALMPFMKNQVF
jgi:8-oxo-dGTP pyrophosphatase MutT (NUDIX family)